MVAVSMKWILFILHLKVALDACKADSKEDEYPDINHLFNTGGKSTNPPSISYKDVVIKNISVDLEKLDIKKFKSKLEVMKSKINDSSYEKVHDTLLKPSRRQKELDWYSVLDNFIVANAGVYMTAQKSYDVMLQYIYMAKHKLNILQTNRYFSTTDTGYRIGYGYRKLNRMYRRMRDIYSMMVQNSTTFVATDIHLQLHLKATKIHVDFLYLWWVLVRVDGKYRSRIGAGNTVPEWMYYPYTSGFHPSHTFHPRQKPKVAGIDKLISSYLKKNLTALPDASLLEYVLDDRRYKPDNFSNYFMNTQNIGRKNRGISGRRNVNANASELYVQFSFDMMEQSIYGTRYRLRETDFYRHRYQSDPLYKMGYLYGNVLELYGRIEHMAAQQDRLRRFGTLVHFLWYLTLYEKCLAAQVDLTTAVERIFQYQAEYVKVSLRPESREEFRPTT